MWTPDECLINIVLTINNSSGNGLAMNWDLSEAT